MYLICLFCFIKIVNEEVNLHLGKSIHTICLNSQLNIRQTLTRALVNTIESDGTHPVPNFKVGVNTMEEFLSTTSFHRNIFQETIKLCNTMKHNSDISQLAWVVHMIWAVPRLSSSASSSLFVYPSNNYFQLFIIFNKCRIFLLRYIILCIA